MLVDNGANTELEDSDGNPPVDVICSARSCEDAVNTSLEDLLK